MAAEYRSLRIRTHMMEALKFIASSNMRKLVDQSEVLIAQELKRMKRSKKKRLGDDEVLRKILTE